MKITANTRTVVRRNYALITPDGFVSSVIPGWQGCEFRVIINPAMGARFSQHLVDMQPGGIGNGLMDDSECFFYVVSGHCRVEVRGKTLEMRSGSYVFIPPRTSYSFTCDTSAAQLLSFQKIYEPLGGLPFPGLISGNSEDIEPQMYAKDPQLHMQHLLPDTLSFDMAVNIFTYQPGGNLPFVETHVMEHGLLYLAGQGIYRLDEDWYAVSKGDSIWMAPYCPQWFTAMGKEPAVYIYYKDVNRYSMAQ